MTVTNANGDHFRAVYAEGYVLIEVRNDAGDGGKAWFTVDETITAANLLLAAVNEARVLTVEPCECGCGGIPIYDDSEASHMSENGAHGDGSGRVDG